MREQYIEKNFRQASLTLLGKVDAILEDYRTQGYTLSVRQTYYQLVTRNEVANRADEYDKVDRLINDGRMAGLLDWAMIEDRGREIIHPTRWESGAQILRSAAESFHLDLWAGQSIRPFCIVEKDALSGVLGPVCWELDVPLLAAKGYPSATVLRDLAEDYILPAFEDGQEVVVFHLCDHDPSGMDMTRDLEERLSIFARRPVKVERIALNLDQVEAMGLPPNPAKSSDKRFAEYARRFGGESWELDALPPEYLARLVREAVEHYIRPAAWAQRSAAIAATRIRLSDLAEGFAG